MEHGFVMLNSTGTHCHTYQKYTRSLRRLFIFRTCSSGPYGVCIRVVPLYTITVLVCMGILALFRG